MDSTGLLKKTGFITKKERDGDEVYESNHAQLTIEIPLDELIAADVEFLARNQNQVVEISLERTWRETRSRRGSDRQLTLEDEERERDRTTQIRRVLYFAIDGMEPLPEDADDTAIALHICQHFENRETFEVDDVEYAVTSGESGSCPQLFTCDDGDGIGKVIIEGADIIEHVKWILEHPEKEPWSPTLITVHDYLDGEGNRYFVAPENSDDPQSPYGFYMKNADGMILDYAEVPTLDLPVPLNSDDARTALRAWAIEKDWQVVPHEGYGRVYRESPVGDEAPEDKAIYCVLRDEEDEEGYPVFRAHVIEPGKAPVPCNREEWGGFDNPENAQAELDEWQLDFIGYAKLPEIPSTEDEDFVPGEDGAENGADTTEEARPDSAFRFRVYSDNQMNRYFVAEHKQDDSLIQAYRTFKKPFASKKIEVVEAVQSATTAEEAQSLLDSWARSRDFSVAEVNTEPLRDAA